MTQKFFKLKILSLLCFAIAVVFSTQVIADTIVLKAVSAWPRNENATQKDYLPFIAAVNKYIKKTYPGQLRVNYIGGPEVMSTKDQPEGLRMGAIDMLFGTAAYYAGIAPEANVGKLSLKDSAEEMKNGADAIFDKIHREKLNAAYIGRLGSEIQFQLYTVKPVKTVDDLKGFRIRTSAMYIDFIKALGGTPIGMAPGDVYQALERGVVDGYMWPLYSIRPWGWQEVTKYVVGPPFYKVAHPILVNAKKWDSLPAHLQDAIKKVLIEEAAVVDARSMGQMRDEPAILEKAGMKVIRFSPQDEKKYLDMAYSSGWEGQLKMEKEYSSQLRKLLE